MKIGCSLPRLQNPTTNPHPQPEHSNPHNQSLIFRRNLILRATPVCRGDLFSGTPTSPVSFSLLSHTRYIPCSNLLTVTDQLNSR
jgi:hypothetical protein